jgi:transcription elongation factor Elf1
MKTGTASTPATESALDRDILFRCTYCATSLVVDRAAAGLTLKCQRCGQPTTVPAPAGTNPPTASSKPQEVTADVQRRMKENESQRTEITSYINQLSIQLHRWQLRLQTLNERQKQLQSEMASLRESASAKS